MEHFYKNIFNEWFDFQQLYTKVINELPNNASIVEVGCWKGASTAFLAVEAINSNKNIKIYAVDTWKGSTDKYSNLYATDLDMKKYNGNIYELFVNNLKPVNNYITAIQATSIEASAKFDDNSLDFVFLDAGHDYIHVKHDIESWLPKIKINGFIGGHDYQNKDLLGVTKAVDEFFKNKVEIIGPPTASPSWLVKI